MDWSYTEEQQEIRQLARKILEDLATHERLREIESSETGIDPELYAELGRSNLLGVAIEEAFGGSEMGFLSLCVLLQEIGRTVAPVPIVASLGLGGLHSVGVDHVDVEEAARDPVAVLDALLEGDLSLHFLM